MASSGGGALPEWVQNLRLISDEGIVSTLYGFATDPKRFILGIILPYVVTQILGVGKGAINYTLGLYRQIAELFGGTFGIVFRAVAVPYDVIYGILAGIHTSLITAATGLGPLGPVAIPFVYALEIVLVLAATDYLIRIGLLGILESVPVLGVAASITGQAYVALKRQIERARGWLS